jgi:hypothetical protein
MAMDNGAILQQIESLLAQLAQNSPEPEVQHAVMNIQKQVEPLQQLMGAQDTQNMQSGLQNPTGGAPGGGEEEPPGPGGMPGQMPGMTGGHEAGGGGEHHVLEIHIGAGGPKTFADAKKAAMSTHAARGHFDRSTPAGETPSTPRTKSKAKG